MSTLKSVALILLVFVLPTCGQQLVEFDPDAGGSSGSPAGGRGGRGGVGGTGATGVGGRGGTSGTGGTGAPGGAGLGGDAGMGNGGMGADGGMGDAGMGGSAGLGGDPGTGGMAGMSGNGGAGGEAGMGGMGGIGAPLRVLRTNPADEDIEVAINKSITVTFSTAVVPLTVDFTLTGPGATPVPVMAPTRSGNSFTFVPTSGVLAPNTRFTATIAAEASDLDGNTLVSDHVWNFNTGDQAAQLVPQLPVPLGSASNFVILASAGITNIPTSTIVGDIGLSPDAASNITGFTQLALICPEIDGEMYVVDATGPACATPDPVRLTNAKAAAQVAFLNANLAARGTPQAISGDLNGLTLYPGLYASGSSLQISPNGFLYLDAQGDPNAVFVIRSATSITTNAGSEVVLTKAARAANIYWTAGSAVTLGTNSIMKGTILAGTAISLLTGAELEGRALNQGAAAAAITLDRATLILPLP